jgi:solute carrier family 29 (equilibrative nucleoside transporter), member 1/2/3
VNPGIHPLVFTSVHFLVFGVGDLLGRYILSFPSLIIWSGRKLLGLSALRTLFIPLFLMCNVTLPSGSSPSSGGVEATINSDVLFMLIVLLFGVSNGYVSSLCIMSASSLEHNPKLEGRRDDVDVAATVASFCMVGGLAAGSIASFLVRGAICQCNPFSQ